MGASDTNQMHVGSYDEEHDSLLPTSFDRSQQDCSERDDEKFDVRKDNSNDTPFRSYRTWVYSLAVIIVVVTVAVVSYHLGTRRFEVPYHLRTSNEKFFDKVMPQVPLSNMVTAYEDHKEFMTIPLRGQEEPAWDSLLPAGLGYVKADRSLPDMSVVSVFHQMHCLYTLRRAFFSSNKYNADHEDLEDFDFGLDRTVHATHCFEYLRLSLICNADSHLEPVDFSKGEFFGLNTPRQCRDYHQLKAWAEERRAFDATGFLAKGLANHSGHH